MNSKLFPPYSINCRTFTKHISFCAKLYCLFMCAKRIYLLCYLFVCLFFPRIPNVYSFKIPATIEILSQPTYLKATGNGISFLLLFAIIAVRSIVCIGSIGHTPALSLFLCTHKHIASTSTSTFTSDVLLCMLLSHLYWCCCCCCYRRTHTQSVSSIADERWNVVAIAVAWQCVCLRCKYAF